MTNIEEMTKEECNEHIKKMWDLYDDITEQDYHWKKKKDGTRRKKKHKMNVTDFVFYLLRDYYKKADRYDEARVAVERYERNKHDLPCPQCCAESTAKNDDREKHGDDRKITPRKMSEYVGDGKYYCNYCELEYGLDSYGTTDLSEKPKRLEKKPATILESLNKFYKKYGNEKDITLEDKK